MKVNDKLGHFCPGIKLIVQARIAGVLHPDFSNDESGKDKLSLGAF